MLALRTSRRDLPLLLMVAACHLALLPALTQHPPAALLPPIERLTLVMLTPSRTASRVPAPAPLAGAVSRAGVPVPSTAAVPRAGGPAAKRAMAAATVSTVSTVAVQTPAATMPAAAPAAADAVSSPAPDFGAAMPDNRIDRDAALRTAREVAKEQERDLTRRGLMANRPRSLEERLGKDIQNAARADCRTAYLGGSPLMSALLLVKDTVSGSGCKWD